MIKLLVDRVLACQLIFIRKICLSYLPSGLIPPDTMCTYKITTGGNMLELYMKSSETVKTYDKISQEIYTLISRVLGIKAIDLVDLQTGRKRQLALPLFELSCESIEKELHVFKKTLRLDGFSFSTGLNIRTRLFRNYCEIRITEEINKKIYSIISATCCLYSAQGHNINLRSNRYYNKNYMDLSAPYIAYNKENNDRFSEEEYSNVLFPFLLFTCWGYLLYIFLDNAKTYNSNCFNRYKH